MVEARSVNVKSTTTTAAESSGITVLTCKLIFFVDSHIMVTTRYSDHEGGCRFMAAWVKEEGKVSKHRQRKREAEEADKFEVAPGVTVASLRRFRPALIGPTQGLPERRRLWR